VAVETKVKPAQRDVNVSTALTFLALVQQNSMLLQMLLS